ncbi:MAG: metallophosphoesterase [Muribaculaceae bacterium]|nr:metallophosphoesterase [Muribaculaceae bacterium]
MCKARFKSKLPRRAVIWSAIVANVALGVIVLLPRESGGESVMQVVMWGLYAYFSIYFPKFIFLIFDAVASIPRLWKGKAWGWMDVTGGTIALIVFATMWWAATINRLSVDVVEKEVEIAGLPEAFDGYRIAQISDLHTGTYGKSNLHINRLVGKINEAEADAVVFTGDIVNSQSEELRPHVEALAKMHAKDGCYAILGNHDYGDYHIWPSAEAKKANMDTLEALYSRTPMRLLRNETVMLRRGSDSIALIGVENIGEPPFNTYGSLDASYPKLDDETTKILLSHNPRHWDDSIAGNPDVNVALTLSGHTHAMQIEVGGHSPASLRYETWGGLYSDKDKDYNGGMGNLADRNGNEREHQLYVNIGAGTVGVPFRLGATPELTIITLRAKK